MATSKLSIVRPSSPEPEPVELRTDYRVGALTFNAFDLAQRQADVIGGDVIKVVTRESRSVVYRAGRKGDTA